MRVLMKYNSFLYVFIITCSLLPGLSAMESAPLNRPVEEQSVADKIINFFETINKFKAHKDHHTRAAMQKALAALELMQEKIESSVAIKRLLADTIPDDKLIETTKKMVVEEYLKQGPSDNDIQRVFSYLSTKAKDNTDPNGTADKQLFTDSLNAEKGNEYLQKATNQELHARIKKANLAKVGREIEKKRIVFKPRLENQPLQPAYQQPQWLTYQQQPLAIEWHNNSSTGQNYAPQQEINEQRVTTVPQQKRIISSPNQPLRLTYQQPAAIKWYNPGNEPSPLPDSFMSLLEHMKARFWLYLKNLTPQSLVKAYQQRKNADN